VMKRDLDGQGEHRLRDNGLLRRNRILAAARAGESIELAGKP
jgi:hypothetical protein